MISFGDWFHTGQVEFTNGNTKGIQNFKGKNLDDVYIQIRKFIEELNNE